MLAKSAVFMIPLLVAALGGLFTELAGVLNIALEGLILAGAFTAVITTEVTGSLLWGITAAMAVSTLIALIFSVASLDLKGNIFVTGLAVNILVPALIAIISKSLYGTKGVIRLENAQLSINGIAALLMALSLTALFSAVLRFTPFGLRIRTAGMNPDFLRIRGIRPGKIQRYVILISGAACGLSGAVISLSLGVFIPGISAGKGWIALVAVYLGNKKPFPVLLACFLFALAEALSDTAQGLIEIPATIILSFPYFVTVLGLVLFSIFRKQKQQ